MNVRICVFVTERQRKAKLSLFLSKHDAIMTQERVEVSGQLLAMADLLPGKYLTVPFE